MASGVEMEREYILLINYINMHVRNKHKNGPLSNLQLDKLNTQLSRVNRNKSRITNITLFTGAI